jgi:uncharacterized protein YeaC (DUF1315 family)
MNLRQLALILSVLAFVVTSPIAQAHVPYTQRFQVVDFNKTHLMELEHNFPEVIVDHVTSLGYEVYGPEGLSIELNKLGLAFASEQIITEMQALQQKYPNLITLTEIGKSVEGRSLMFARVTAPGDASARSEFKYIANMHGDEIAGREMMVTLIEDLASNYGKDARITKMLESVQVYIMPSMNPDGATHQDRFNSNNTDLNRSFPDFTTSDNANTPDNREPEIQAVMKFQAQHHFKISANFHGGAEVVNYPWDAQAALNPNDAYFKKVSLAYSKSVPYIYASTDFPQGITNGFAWYQVLGGMQDWSNHWYNDLQITIELTTVKWPELATVAETYKQNREALLGYIEQIYNIK